LPARRSASCSASATSRTSSRSSAWTSSPKRTRPRLPAARRLQRFASQPFHVAEVFTGRPGAYVAIRDTVASFKEILEGNADTLPSRPSSWQARSDDVPRERRQDAGLIPMPIHLEIVTPERRAYSDDVDMVVVPGADASSGSCPATPPLLATLGTASCGSPRAGQRSPSRSSAASSRPARTGSW